MKVLLSLLGIEAIAIIATSQIEIDNSIVGMAITSVLIVIVAVMTWWVCGKKK